MELSKRLFAGADLLRRVPDACVGIVRLRTADVTKVVEEAKREQEQGVLRVQRDRFFFRA